MWVISPSALNTASRCTTLPARWGGAAAAASPVWASGACIERAFAADALHCAHIVLPWQQTGGAASRKPHLSWLPVRWRRRCHRRHPGRSLGPPSVRWCLRRLGTGAPGPRRLVSWFWFGLVWFGRGWYWAGASGPHGEPRAAANWLQTSHPWAQAPHPPSATAHPPPPTHAPTSVTSILSAKSGPSFSSSAISCSMLLGSVTFFSWRWSRNALTMSDTSWWGGAAAACIWRALGVHLACIGCAFGVHLGDAVERWSGDPPPPTPNPPATQAATGRRHPGAAPRSQSPPARCWPPLGPRGCAQPPAGGGPRPRCCCAGGWFGGVRIGGAGWGCVATRCCCGDGCSCKTWCAASKSTHQNRVPNTKASAQSTHARPHLQGHDVLLRRRDLREPGVGERRRQRCQLSSGHLARTCPWTVCGVCGCWCAAGCLPQACGVLYRRARHHRMCAAAAAGCRCGSEKQGRADSARAGAMQRAAATQKPGELATTYTVSYTVNDSREIRTARRDESWFWFREGAIWLRLNWAFTVSRVFLSGRITVCYAGCTIGATQTAVVEMRKSSASGRWAAGRWWSATGCIRLVQKTTQAVCALKRPDALNSPPILLHSHANVCGARGSSSDRAVASGEAAKHRRQRQPSRLWGSSR